MPDETTALIDRVRTLLDAPLDGTPRGRARIEYTLTEGYARVLAVEAEQRRLEQRIAELTTELDGRGDQVSELALLVQRRLSAAEEISRLRAVLSRLRDRLTASAAAALL